MASTKSPRLPAQADDWEDVNDWQDVEADDWQDVPENSGFLNSVESLLGDIGSGVASGISTVGTVVDSVTAAPVRKGLLSAKEGKPAGDILADVWQQFASDPAKAPTGPELARAYGVSSDPILDPAQLKLNMEMDPIAWKDSQAMTAIPKDKAVGLGIEIGADITNLIPIGTGLKFGGKALGKLAGGATKATAVAADLATGTQVASKTVDAVGEGIKSSSSAISKLTKPGRADNYPKFLRIAQENNIDPNLLSASVEFGPESFPARASRQRAEGVLGAEHLKKHEKGLEAVQDALDFKIETIGGGRPLDEAEAGMHLMSAYDQGLDDFFSKMEITYNSLQEAIPGMVLTEKATKKLDSKVNGIERFAKGLVARGITKTDKTQGKQLLAAVESIRNANGSYKQAVEALDMIGRSAFASSNRMADIAPDTRKLQDLYFTLRDSIIDTAEEFAGTPVAKVLRENNAAMSEILGDRSLLGSVLGNTKMAPEKVFQSLIVNGDTKRIGALKKILAPEDLQALKGAFLGNIIKRNPDGTFTFRSLHNTLRSRKPAIKALFSEDEIRQVEELIELGDAFGPPILSSPGTGASNVFRAIPTAIGDAVANDAIIENVMQSARAGKPLTTEVAPNTAKAAGAPVTPAYAPTKSPSFYEKNLTRSRPGNILKGSQVMAVQSYPREDYGGYSPDQVIDVPVDQVEAYRKEIQNSEMDSIELARRLNLLNKFGKRPQQ